MAMDKKSIDEVQLWLSDKGFGEYASKFHGKWTEIKTLHS